MLRSDSIQVENSESRKHQVEGFISISSYCTVSLALEIGLFPFETVTVS